MKIIVLNGSPNVHGSTAILCDHFEQGAQEAGHETELVNVAHINLHPCGGCVACGYEGPCAIHDDMQILKPKILDADMLVLATPLYYYGMTAQLKAVVDRFCAFSSSLNSKHMKISLLTVAWNSSDWTFDALGVHYDTLVRYINFQDMGRVLGYGCGTPSMTRNSRYPRKAYELGKSLR